MVFGFSCADDSGLFSGFTSCPIDATRASVSDGFSLRLLDAFSGAVDVAPSPVAALWGSGHFETTKIHFPMSEGVSEVSERANE